MKKLIAMVSSFLVLCGSFATCMPVQAVSHTFEGEHSPEWYESYLETVKDQWYQDENGVIYCTENAYDNMFDMYIPNAGTFDRSGLLLALLNQYPDSQFAVQFRLWSEEGAAEIRAEEERYLRENGISFTESGANTKYAVLTAEQLADFPVYEKVGYLIGLAAEADYPVISDMLGDLDGNAKCNLLDIVWLQKYLLSMVDFNADQLYYADLTQDGAVDGFDLAFIKRKILEA